MNSKNFLLFISLFTFQFVFSQNKDVVIEKHELFFENDASNLNEDDILLLKKWFSSDEKYEITKIIIEAHCDSKGSIDYNLILSQKRADFVMSHIPESLHKNRVSVAHGKSKPKYSNREEHKNRRVDIEIHKKIIIIPEKIEINTIEKQTVLETKSEIKVIEKAEKILKAEVGETISFDDIQFHPGTPTPLSSSIPTMEALANILLENETLEIEIQGHICCVSADSDNISTKRALTVYNFLIESGVNKSRLKYKGYGRTRPKTEERTPQEAQMNRRVEIKVLKK